MRFFYTLIFFFIAIMGIGIESLIIVRLCKIEDEKQLRAIRAIIFSNIITFVIGFIIASYMGGI